MALNPGQGIGLCRVCNRAEAMGGAAFQAGGRSAKSPHQSSGRDMGQPS